jgi:CRISPR-associated helicase Cas3/CRISPR-associated endonuclease Cas3-HD
MSSPLDQVWAKSRTSKSAARGELLTEHLRDTRDAARELRARVGVIPGVPEYFWDCVVLAGILHDAGKIPAGFQRMVGNPGPPVPWGERHEVYSLGFAAHALAGLPEDQLDLIQAGIATHHRPLEGGDQPLRGFLNNRYTSPQLLAQAIEPVDPAVAAALHAWLLAEIGLAAAPAPGLDALAEAAYRGLARVVGQWADQDRDGLTAVLFQGAVTLADHAASAHSRIVPGQPADSAFAENLTARLEQDGRSLFPHQAQASRASGHLLLRAPTGYGKTEAALLWAAGQVERLRELTGGDPRLFYTLPYLASVNAMSDRLREEFGDTSDQLVGVAHSRAASYYLRLAAEGDCGIRDGNEDELMNRAALHAVARNRATRLFREPVRIGTPYQLVRGALAGAKHSGIMVDAANSVYVLDELHAYEPRKLGIILAMIGLWTRLGGKIGVISATLPRALAELVTMALGEQPDVVEPPQDWPWPARHRLWLREQHITAPESVTDIAAPLSEDRSVLVVANTVNDALELYRELSPLVTKRHGADAALLLHSRFRAGDRAAIEKKITARFASGGPRRPGLLVATQTVEVSLDIDLDVLHTSAAPLEALIQRFGRVNRLGQLPGPAPVVVHQPRYGPSHGGAPDEYADGVYEADPVRLAWQILARRHGGTLDEKMFSGWLDEIYASDWGRQWRLNVERTYRNWAKNWLEFRDPFVDRGELEDDFDQLFNGTEAILSQDAGEYRRLLNENTPSAGRLLAANLVIPVWRWAARVGRWDKELGIIVIDGDYDPALGLLAVRAPGATGTYARGEVL